MGQGSRVLDVGCGLGFDVITMGKIVGKSGRVVGVDFSTAMIAKAKRRSEGLGLISRKEANGWIFELTKMDAAGRFFGCHSCFLVKGCKP